MFNSLQRPVLRLAIVISSILLTLTLILSGYAVMSGLANQPDASIQAPEAQTITGTVFLPSIMTDYPWNNYFGFETTSSFLESSPIYGRALELDPGLSRMGLRVLWSELQPSEADPILWDQLVNFENELRSLKAAGIKPVVLIKHAPEWALMENVREDGQPTACGPIKADKFEAFASFLEQLVARYSTQEFNVHDWEIGNEPDVDPDLVPIDYGFGCWGDIDDPLYGGEYFGSMLNYVAPRIRQADPGATIWLGGLLLATPNTTDPAKGKPEFFLKGILEAGAGDSFDVVPYHWHPSYWDATDDYDLNGSVWDARGGGVRGKAEYIRQTLSAYGLDKPLVLNETGFGCREDQVFCIGPTYPEEKFFQNQADMLIRMYVRGASVDLDGIIWYTLNGPGWRNAGLLNNDYSYRPAFVAYKTMVEYLSGSYYTSSVDYGAGIEAYEFTLPGERIHVLWTLSPNASLTAEVPESQFIDSQLRDGSVYTPTLADGVYQFDVSFVPMFIRLTE